MNFCDDITRRVRIGHRVTVLSSTPLLDFLIETLGDDEGICRTSVICEHCITQADKKELQNSKDKKKNSKKTGLLGKRSRSQSNSNVTKKGPGRPKKCRYASNESLSNGTSPYKNCTSSHLKKSSRPSVSIELKENGENVKENNDIERMQIDSDSLSINSIESDKSDVKCIESSNTRIKCIDSKITGHNGVSIKCEALDESFLTTHIVTPSLSPGKIIESELQSDVCDPDVLPSVVVKTEDCDDSFEAGPVHFISADASNHEIDTDPNYSSNSEEVTDFNKSLVHDSSEDQAENVSLDSINTTNSYICPLCNKVFASVEEFKEHHLSAHVISHQIQCSLCSYVASSDRAIESHMREFHNQTDQYTCQNCNEKFIFQAFFEQHMKIAHKSQKTSSSVVVDRASNSTNVEHICPICNEKFRGFRSMAKHNREEHGGQKYQCKYCPFKCSSDMTMKRHDAKIHKKQSIIIHDCILCNIGFDTVELLEEHSLTLHNLQKDHRCDLCGECFATKLMMRTHRQRHNPHNCSLCHIGFKKKENLVLHLATVHNHDKPENTSMMEVSGTEAQLCYKSDESMELSGENSVRPKLGSDDSFALDYFPEMNVEGYLTSLEYDEVLAEEWMKKIKGRPYNEKIECVFCMKEVTCSHLRTHFKSHSGEKVYDCPHCDKRCIQSTNLRKHIRKKHPEKYESPKKPKKKRAECEFCKIMCDNFEALEVHLWEHMTEKGFQCGECQMKFGVKDSYNDHLKIHYFKERKECDVCKRKFKSIGYYDEHVEKCHSKWKCEECGELCLTVSNYRKHLKSAHPTTDTQKYVCPKSGCEKIFFDKHRYNDHQITHDKEKRFQCPKCHKKFKRLRPMREHISSKHSSVECIDCGYSFSCIVELTQHRANSHTYLSCPTCAIYFLNKKTLKNHFITSHPNDDHFKILLCETCNNVFESEAALKKHSLIHSAIHQVCSINDCFVTFNNEENCRNHMMEQHGEYNFNCVLCQKEYDSELSLKEHINSSHEAAVICNKCGLEFMSTTHLDNHLLLHSDDQRYSCTACEFYTPNRFWFISHMKRHHCNKTEFVDMDEWLIRERMFGCSTCNVVSETEQEMNEHIASHAASEVEANILSVLQEKKLFEVTTLSQCPICEVQLPDLDTVKQHFEESPQCNALLRISEESTVTDSEFAEQQQESSELVDPTTLQYIMQSDSDKEMIVPAPYNASSDTADKQDLTYQLATDNEGQLMIYQADSGTALMTNCDESSLQVLLGSALLSSNGQIIIPQDE